MFSIDWLVELQSFAFGDLQFSTVAGEASRHLIGKNTPFKTCRMIAAQRNKQV
jgi:hypothetical protein